MEDARDLYRTVFHFSVRTPLSRGYLRRFVDLGGDVTPLGRDGQDAFENVASAFQGWDRTFHLACVRILHSDEDLLTSACPTSSFDEGMDVNGVAFNHHVTMAIDRRVLAHVMVRGFDLRERVEQRFWVAPAEERIVSLHNLAQIARFESSPDVEYLVHSGEASTALVHRCLSLLGWTATAGTRGRS